MRPQFPYARPGLAPQDPASPRWHRLSDYFLHQFGEKVRKIPLDAGFSCPNRDGKISRSGCVFCNEEGSGTGLGRQGLSLAEQWEARRQSFRQKGVRLFVAYLQSFSNTYGPLERLAAVLDEIKALPDVAGLSIGTRPDCVDDEKLALIASTCAEQSWKERWIEFGVQSSNNATLARINRGHDIACAEAAIQAAARAGLKICVHLIAALPGEGEKEFLESTAWASRQPIQAVKFHCLYVCRGTAMQRLFETGEYRPFTQEEYVEAVAAALPLLRPDIVVQRITGDPAPGELAAPAWASQSRDTANKILAALTRRNSWQGKDCKSQ